MSVQVAHRQQELEEKYWGQERPVTTGLGWSEWTSLRRCRGSKDLQEGQAGTPWVPGRSLPPSRLQGGA